jgi:hypothetical protein
MEREALKLALGALDSENPDIQCRAALAIRAALAQPAQEPVAWALEWTFDGEEKGIRLYDDERHCKLDAENDGGICRPLVYGYTTPPQREWVGLTDEEKAELVHELFAPCNKEANDVLYRLTTYYANNALYLLTAHYNKLKERNHGT